MKGNFNEKLHEMWDRFKKNKKLQIGLIVGLLLIVVVSYFALINKRDKSTAEPTTETNTTSSYVDYLEDKLENTLSSIDGVGKLDVIITLGSGFEYVYATEETTKESGGGSLTTKTLILVSGQPVMVKEIYPIIKGVVVISSGAKDVGVRLNLLSAIQTVLEVPNTSITILN